MIDQPALIAAARAWYGNGFCVVPPRADGSKGPISQWKDFQTVRPTPQQMGSWYDSGWQQGVGIICGAVSGNLEMFELEGRATDAASLTAIRRACKDAGILWLWEAFEEEGYSEVTPSGGMHLLYRIEDHEVPGNTKVATRPKADNELNDDERELRARRPDAPLRHTLAETRGEGGYVIVAPSGGTVHPSGDGWQLISGAYGVVPTINWEDRCALHAAVASVLDVPIVRPERPAPASRPSMPINGSTRVGDDYNARGDWQILIDYGWTVDRVEGHTTYWMRPGKSHGRHSATTGHDPLADRLYVFSSSTEFPTEEPLSRFFVYTELEHAGDWRAATKALAALGYGEQRPAPATYPILGNFVPMIVAETAATVASPPPPAVPTVAPVLALPAAGRESYTDTGTANRFLREHPHRFLYVRNMEEWLYYNGIVWQRDETQRMVGDAVEAMIDRMSDEAKAMTGEEATATMGKELAKYVRGARMNSGRKGLLATIAAKLSVTTADLDRHRHLVGLLNGILDVRTGDVIAPDPAFLVTKSFGAAYDPRALAPQTEKFFETVLPDAGIRDFVQRAIGYTMTGEQDQRAFFIVHGVKGTGKSQFVELLDKMFGGYSTVAADAAFRKRERGSTGPTAELHALQGARYVFASESDEDVVFDADIVKRVCGGDTMSTRTLYEKRPTKWRPEFVVWLATNNFPRFPADEEAVWDRVKPIHFPTVFERDGSSVNDRILSISDVLFREEASGILNLMIAWLKRYREQGLAEPQALLANIDERKTESDPVAQFWAEMVETGEVVRDDEGELDFAALYTHYSTWSERTLNVTPRGSRRFGACLRAIIKCKPVERRHGRSYLLGWKKMGYNGVLGTMGGKSWTT